MQPNIRSLFLFLAFFILTLIAYWQTRHGGFITDFYGWQLRYDAGDWSSVWKSFDFPALHPVLHFINYTWYKCFATNGLAYYLLYSLLHALNGFLVSHIFQRVFHIFKIKSAFAIGLTAALFFLLSPYQTEVLVWRVCLHYLLATGLILTSWKWAIAYLEQPDKRQYLLGSHAAFLVALFTLEISLVTPLLLLTYLLFWSYHFAQWTHFFSHFKRLIAPQFAALVAYLLLNRYLFGAIVGHYGAETHLQFPLAQMAANYFKYIVKHLFFVRYFSHDFKMQIFNLFDQPFILWGSVTLLILAFAGGIYFYKKIAPRTRLTLLLFAFIALALAPVLNLFFATLLPIENDRYGYFASVFIYALLALLFFGLPKWLRTPLVIFYLAASVFYLHKTTTYWAEGTKMYQSLLADYRWQDAKKVYVLNAPDNYRGMLMFRRYDSDNSLITPLRLTQGIEPAGEIIDIAQYNPPRITAGATVTQDSTGIIKVKLNQWGDWWWRKGYGANNYSTDDFSVKFSTIEYQLEFKEPPTDAVFIYQDSLRWKEFIYEY